ncbi:hypothetical protein [Streptomyces sp. 6N223]|uniref:hypothetical protein n=1 Tax=Streptomyces sp. 6N223 TaxID=3457412 RepID=UPI003FD3324D
MLLITLVFFVFAQAAFVRNKGQAAADAAALAAATEARDQLYDRFLDAIDGDGDLGDVLEAEDIATGSACDEAAPRLAGENDADVSSCGLASDGSGFTVGVTTRDTIGDTVVPGTEDQAYDAEATAVIRGLCEVSDEADDQVELDCDDEDLSFDPGDEDGLPDARELFQVYLED